MVYCNKSIIGSQSIDMIQHLLKDVTRKNVRFFKFIRNEET